MAGNLFSQSFAGKFVDARNRHQILHGRIRTDFSQPNRLLHGLGQFSCERQAFGS
jgi:hypothetical protein